MGDPRHYQILVLSSLLMWGWWGLGFDLAVGQVGVTLGAVVLAQLGFTRWWRGAWDWELRSALISGLSLCLLCRTPSLALAAATAALAIGSKFLLRVEGKHWFNPTNFGLMMMVGLTGGQVWVSPGQWGSAAILAFFFACLGGLVVTKARRADVALTFLAVWAALLVGRSLWLGEPLTIPLHRLENGGLLLFAFFMISDPRSTPDSRLGRMVLACLVALVGWWWQFLQYGTNGPLWALLWLSPLTVVLDRWFPASRFEWRSAPVPLTHLPAS
jgi:Na+-transporting NADH:ubiquinone oxidoreductase subunit NqrB